MTALSRVTLASAGLSCGIQFLVVISLYRLHTVSQKPGMHVVPYMDHFFRAKRTTYSAVSDPERGIAKTIVRRSVFPSVCDVEELWSYYSWNSAK